MDIVPLQAARDSISRLQQANTSLQGQLQAAAHGKIPNETSSDVLKLPSGPGSLASGTDFWLAGPQVLTTHATHPPAWVLPAGCIKSERCCRCCADAFRCPPMRGAPALLYALSRLPHEGRGMLWARRLWHPHAEALVHCSMHDRATPATCTDMQHPRSWLLQTALEQQQPPTEQPQPQTSPQPQPIPQPSHHEDTARLTRQLLTAQGQLTRLHAENERLMEWGNELRAAQHRLSMASSAPHLLDQNPQAEHVAQMPPHLWTGAPARHHLGGGRAWQSSAQQAWGRHCQAVRCSCGAHAHACQASKAGPQHESAGNACGSTLAGQQAPMQAASSPPFSSQVTA